MADTWRIKRLKGRWWLLKPSTQPQPWIAAHVGTYNECRDTLIRRLRETT